MHSNSWPAMFGSRRYSTRYAAVAIDVFTDQPSTVFGPFDLRSDAAAFADSHNDDAFDPHRYVVVESYAPETDAP